MALPRQRLLGNLMVAMALGQVGLAIALSWVASRYPLRDLEEFRSKVELPLWFTILPLLTAAGVSAHMLSSRHIDRACPWVALGWLILGVNILVLALIIGMTL